ncbi:MAG TPA: CDP-alcohol phosphatidyltransferase family protein [Candidatus Nitrosotenuis sp.]|nr:CDP-alcohol phosphatidyltransferase family protein [Candidatus Nitrosotenuis sp.]
MAQPPKEFHSAERVQKSVLTALEKRTLRWLAERMPAWVNSDHLTVLGFLGMLGAGASYWLAATDRRGLLLVILFLIVNWFGDSLDGTLARVRNAQRPRYGFYVDHIVDTFGALALLGGLALSNYMSPLAAAALLLAYYILSIETYLTTYALGEFHMSFAGLGPSELRILLAIGNVWLYFQREVPRVHFLSRDWLLFDLGGLIAAAGMLVVSCVLTARHTLELYRAESIPK